MTDILVKAVMGILFAGLCLMAAGVIGSYLFLAVMLVIQPWT